MNKIDKQHPSWGAWLRRNSFKIGKAAVIAAAKEIPGLGFAVELYSQWKHQDTDEEMEELQQEVMEVIHEGKFDEQDLVSLENLNEQKIADSFSQTAAAMTIPRKEVITQLANQLQQTQNPKEQQKILHKLTQQTLIGARETISKTRYSFVSSLHSSQNEEIKFSLGEVIQNRYEIRDLVGSGGMGTIYKVYDQNFDELRAIKTIATSLNSDEKFRKKFKEEVRLSMKLSHENILRVYDMGEIQGMLFFIMEWIEGKSLRRLLSEHKKLSWSVTKKIFGDIANGLIYAHNKGVIHLDLKPENIMIHTEGHVKIVDFGLARKIDEKSQVKLSVTQGTDGYMAPEQYDLKSEVGKAADIYAFSIMIYETLWGKVPRGRFASLEEVCPDVPLPVCHIIMQSLEPDPKRRPCNMEEILKIFEDVEPKWQSTNKTNKTKTEFNEKDIRKPSTDQKQRGTQEKQIFTFFNDSTPTETETETQKRHIFTVSGDNVQGSCNFCGKLIQVPKSRASQSDNCAYCGKTVFIPNRIWSHEKQDYVTVEPITPQVSLSQNRTATQPSSDTEEIRHRRERKNRVVIAALVLIGIVVMGLYGMENQRIAAEQKKKEETWIGAEKKKKEKEKERVAEQKRKEQERIAEEKKNSKRYQVSNEGVIYDNTTGLEWYVGPDKDIRWDEAIKWVSDLNVAGGGWRMPKVEELRALYEKGKGIRNIDPAFQMSGWLVWSGELVNNNNKYLTYIKNNKYLTELNNLNNLPCARNFYFGNGDDDWDDRSRVHYYRVFGVRSGRRG